MAIGSAVQKGRFVYVYDDRGRQLVSIAVQSANALQGYTSNTVSIRKGNFIYVYDEKGHQKSSIFAK